jgi:hypothetical protein
MDLLEKFAEDAKRYMITRPEGRNRTLLGILNALAEFEKRIDEARVADIPNIDEDTIPMSAEYNDTVQMIMDDLNSIRIHQIYIISNLLTSWNEIEQVISSEEEETTVDREFSLFSTMAAVNGHTTLGVKVSQSAIQQLKEPPKLTAACSDSTVVPIYGKSYGLYVKGNETGEDGVRPDDNDGTKIIDNKDTFWEAEAVTLQEKMDDDTYSPQITNTNEISLSVNITCVFKAPININFFSIDPHAFAQSNYYDITSINVISGATTIPVLTDLVTVTGKTRVTFNTTMANAIQVSLLQNKGYYQKYSLAKYSIGNNSLWIDITGPHLIEKIGVKTGDINKVVREQIEDANEWIASIWMPDAPTSESAVLDYLAGDEGYMRIDSSESKRKRWAIGIQEIDFGEELYEDVSEVVSLPYDMPDETTSVYVLADEDVPSGTEIIYMLSFDDGATWSEILPLNSKPKLKDTGYLIPQRIYINNDLSFTRKQNSLTGIDGFVNTPNRKLRTRAILKKGETSSNTPRIKSLLPVFDTSVPT